MLTLVLTVFLAATDEAPWQAQSPDGDIQVESRKVKGSSFSAYRLSAKCAVPAEVQAAAIWGPVGIEGAANKAVRLHDVLEDQPMRRKFYEVVSAPLISERDYVIVLDRRVDGQVYEIRFQTIDDPAHPPQKDKVRMRVKGSAVVEPDGEGTSLLTYEIHVDLGGSIPAWVANGAQRDSAVEWVRVMLGRGKKRLAEAKK